MRYKLLVVGFVILSWACLSFAQYRNTSPGGDPGDYLRQSSALGIKLLHGLLDPTRMHMTNSVSFGYMSSGGRGATQGLYMNHLDYAISRTLDLSTNLGYQFQPSGPAEWNPSLNGTDFVGGAELNWRPTSNTNFRFSFSRGMQQNYSYGDYGWSPYEYHPFLYRP